MKIGIDARFITRHPRRGIGNYSLNVVAALVRLFPQTHFYLYISIPDSEAILPVAPNVTVRRLAMPAYPLWEQVALPRAAAADRLDVLHCLGNTAPVFMPKSVRLILSLMDVMFLQSGEFVPSPTNRYQAWGRHYRRVVAPRCARAAHDVVTISEFSRQDILSLIDGLDPARVHVTHLSCDAIFQQLPGTTARADVGAAVAPYIFALGADDPRKNTLRLVEAYLALLRENDLGYDLVISGYSQWEHGEAYQAVVNAGQADRVHFHGFISIEALAVLYREAALFVYPSLYEGFGIPILEAFSSGCPVIASGTTSIPEVGGDAALYVDPLDSADIAATMLRVLRDDALRSDLAQRGRDRAAQFTWEATARQTHGLYERSFSTGSAA
jgi:glycosyltransferase involved in cell wall biosynthesis